MCVWNDASIDWADFDLTVIRSTWDYTRDRDGLPDVGPRHRTTAQPVSDHRVLDRQALPRRPRARSGHRIVPSTFCDVGEEPQFPDGRFVVKPTVGAGSIDAEKYGTERPRTRAPRTCVRCTPAVATR